VLTQGEAFEKCAATMQLQSLAGSRPLTALQTDKYIIKRRNAVATINGSRKAGGSYTQNKCQLTLPLKRHLMDDRMNKGRIK